MLRVSKGRGPELSFILSRCGRYLAVGSAYGCVAIWKFVGEYESAEEPSTTEVAHHSANGKQASVYQVEG